MQNLALKELSGPSSEEANVALDLKHAELAVRDLIVAVNHSNLTVRQPLAVSLEQFVLDARAAGRELQKLSARVLGLFDRSVSVCCEIATLFIEPLFHIGSRHSNPMLFSLKVETV